LTDAGETHAGKRGKLERIGGGRGGGRTVLSMGKGVRTQEGRFRDST